MVEHIQKTCRRRQVIKDVRVRSKALGNNGDAIAYFMGTQARDFQLEKSYEAAYEDERKAEEEENYMETNVEEAVEIDHARETFRG